MDGLLAGVDPTDAIDCDERGLEFGVFINDWRVRCSSERSSKKVSSSLFNTTSGTGGLLLRYDRSGVAR